MFIRRRGLVKYLITIPIVWIIFVVFFRGASNENSNEKPGAIEEDMIRILVQKARDTQKPTAGEIQHEHLKDKNNGMPPPDDHDHPHEEVKKAEEQNRNPGGKIQVNAPIKHDLNAPG